jgi:CheY-like chemotaxis protein
MKVLVVDDVGYTRHHFTRLLQKLGYQTATAESGPQALRLLERDMTISVVLTDLMMREMDGVELFKRSQQINRLVDGGTADPPAFILMTALRPGQDNCQQKDVEKIRMAKDMGFIDVLFKPVEPDVLKKTLETVKYARSCIQIDTVGTLERVAETVERLIGENQLEDAGKFLDDLRRELERLDEFVAQPVEQ